MVAAMNEEIDLKQIAAGHRDRLRLLAVLRRTWRQRIVDSVDQRQVLDKVDDESGLTGRFIFMTAMSAAIAMLGMLLSSPAVVIGAMLLSPLMNPIIGAGFALAVGDFRELRRCTRTLAWGSILAVGFTAIIVFLSPIQTVTAEIAARTRPNLFDLLVALFSALAGAYALIRGRGETIVGVAIATALMPPLAVVGFGLATLNWTVFGGSLLLFVTNFVTIALVAAIMARFYGFSTYLTKKQTRLQTLGILASFALLAIPLSVALKQIAWEAAASREARGALQTTFPANARVTQVELDHSQGRSAILASVLTPSFRPGADRAVEARLRERLGRPVNVTINQYLVGTDLGAAEQAELLAARDKAQAEASEREIAAILARLSAVSGTPEADIVIDRDHKRLIAVATPLDGATLAAYRAMERRVATAAPDWSVEIRPPLLPVPPIAVTDGTPDPQAMALATWAARRLGVPVAIRGREADRSAVRAGLAEAGIRPVEETDGANGTVVMSWVAVPR